MQKITYLVELDKLDLFLSIIENNGGQFIKYLDTTSGRLAVTFSTLSPVHMFLIGFKLGCYSSVIIKN